MIELDASGEQPLYRPRKWKRLERAQERRGKRESWYRKGGFDTLIFVPATPGSQLKNRYIEEIEGAGFKIKVVEQSGVTLKRMLQRSDPFREKECNNTNSLVCSTDGKGPCRSTGVTYEWYVNFATGNTSGRHHEVHTPAERNTCELWNRGSKVR